MAIAVVRGTPARSKLRTAVRRKSCGMRSRPAARCAPRRVVLANLRAVRPAEDRGNHDSSAAFNLRHEFPLPLQDLAHPRAELELASGGFIFGLAWVQPQPSLAIEFDVSPLPGQQL